MILHLEGLELSSVLLKSPSKAAVCAEWTRYVEECTSRMAEELGVDACIDVSAQLYKLLLYQKGVQLSASL